jgi:hypothetical protein
MEKANLSSGSTVPLFSTSFSILNTASQFQLATSVDVLLESNVSSRISTIPSSSRSSYVVESC